MNALVINSSGRTEQSVSRKLVAELVAELLVLYPKLHVNYRDVARGIPLVDDQMIEGFFTPDEYRTPELRQALAVSDELVDELRAADVLIIGAPVYNLSIPACLKAWLDLVVRMGLTFTHSSAGYEGLLTTRKAYLVVTSGSVAVGTPWDFATPYLRTILGFMGIVDVEIISATQLIVLSEAPISEAREAIHHLATA
ncbi:FMN-dependent NADH-azoreductase [Hymenobacter edaphi]|uniref:FMN dependent NADH:quinone oxidoreductase n=1 Tax=Hymenobacter edaphi TaxID=2211146 RepID=A0A328BD01_9BACT|nr:NAD(P)H-dependent oxidoreductase [Hymenobacter edaphi]RAK65212.1 FMN-dependent NADH-azoreductase [Hymenobacter edaphi]